MIASGDDAGYSAPRIHAALRAGGQAVSRGRIEREVRHHGIRARATRRDRVCTTDSNHSLPLAPNRLAQTFLANRPIRFG
jgi:putative transposase